MLRIGAVSFLNTFPLIAGLEREPDVRLVRAVPAALAEMLERDEVDAALVPIVDVLRSAGRYRVVSDGCIAADGETMTVRVFSHEPPDRITRLWVDPDSHTSVALARVLWHENFGRDLELLPLPADAAEIGELPAVLLIGDKVVSPARAGFAYEVDLGGAWRQYTGLPFVFAVWVTHARGAGRVDVAALSRALRAARDRGLTQLDDIATHAGPQAGWPVSLATRYLTKCMAYRLTASRISGAERFATSCSKLGLISADAGITWPQELVTESHA